MDVTEYWLYIIKVDHNMFQNPTDVRIIGHFNIFW